LPEIKPDFVPDDAHKIYPFLTGRILTGDVPGGNWEIGDWGSGLQSLTFVEAITPFNLNRYIIS
jgi:hypothetical protein